MSSTDTATAKIIVMGDEAANLKILSKALKSYGYSELKLIQDPRKVLERYAETCWSCASYA